jgi:hypothetical protein
MSDLPERIWYIAYGDFRETPSDRADDVEYIRKDIADAAVRAERERIATMIEATAYTSNGAVRSLEPVSPALVGMDMHHATIAAAIRKENSHEPG